MTETPTTECTKRISSAHSDEETYECGRPATMEALTTSGQWEPHCATHVAGWPTDRVRMTAAPTGPEPRTDADEIVLDDQCPITMRRCDRPCGAECIRGMFADPRTDAAVGR